jgi:hypothetical protein
MLGTVYWRERVGIWHARFRSEATVTSDSKGLVMKPRYQRRSCVGTSSLGTEGIICRNIAPSHRRRSASWFVAACAALFLLPTTALAAPAGVVTLAGSGFEGVSGTLQFHNLNTSNDSVYFANEHLWIYDDGFNYWIEEGADIGVPQGENYGASPTFEWVDNRPNNGGYHAHQLGATGDAAYNTNYDTYIDYKGGGQWNIWVAGYTGLSTLNFISGQNIFAGGETNDPGGARMCEHPSSLGYYDSSNNFVSPWHDSSHGNGVVWSGNGNPPFADWVSQPSASRSYDNESSSC